MHKTCFYINHKDNYKTTIIKTTKLGQKQNGKEKWRFKATRRQKVKGCNKPSYVNNHPQ